MSLASKLQQTGDKIIGGTINDLSIALRDLSTITQQQFAANESSINMPIQKLAEAIQTNINLNKGQVQESQQLRNTIRKTFSKLPQAIQIKLSPLIQNIQTQAQQGQLTNKVQQQVKLAKRAAQQQIERSGGNLQTINVGRMNIIQNGSNQLSPIQQSIERYQPLFNFQLPAPTLPTQIPSTMKILSQYARIQGKIPIGSVSNQLGSSYVGVQQVDRGDGIKQLYPYPKNQIRQSNIPSIPVQIQYYANKAINSWNRYVGDQSNFLSYFSKINTSSNRLAYVQSQFKTLNMYTFMAQAIATLNFYYVFLPLQKYAVKMFRSNHLQSTLSDFLQNYEVGDLIKLNPFLLTNGQGLQLANLLFKTKGDVVSVFKILQQAIDKKKNQMNKDAIFKFSFYWQTRKFQAQQYFQKNGIPQQLSEKIMASQDYSSVKKKKFVLSSSFQNPQIVQIANKAIVSSLANQSQKNQYSLTWGAPYMSCHDYIWKWKQN